VSHGLKARIGGNAAITMLSEDLCGGGALQLSVVRPRRLERRLPLGHLSKLGIFICNPPFTADSCAIMPGTV
jgi:hypothetical protein